MYSYSIRNIENRLLKRIKKQKCILLVFITQGYHDARSTGCEECKNPNTCPFLGQIHALNRRIF